MDFVDKEDWTRARDAQFASSPIERFAQFLDPACDGIDLPESGLGLCGDESCQGCLAGPGGAVEQQRLDAAGLDQTPQKLSGSENMGLPDHLIEGRWPHSGGQRLSALSVGFLGF